MVKNLKNLAASLRKEAQEVRKAELVKAAQVLVAARGIVRLRENLRGDAK